MGLFSRSTSSTEPDPELLSRLFCGGRAEPDRRQLARLAEVQEFARQGAGANPIRHLVEDGIPTSNGFIVFTDDYCFRATKKGILDKTSYLGISGVKFFKPNSGLYVMQFQPSGFAFGIDGKHEASSEFCVHTIGELVNDVKDDVRMHDVVVRSGPMDEAWFDAWIDWVRLEIGMNDEYFSRTNDHESLVALYKKQSAIVHHYARQACEHHGTPSALAAIDAFAKSDEATCEGMVKLVERLAPRGVEKIRRETCRFAVMMIRKCGPDRADPKPIRHDW
jgi:hypothetical protein